MTYEIWDQQTANMVGDFDSEAAALAFVQEASKYNTSIAFGWALAAEDENGDTMPIAAGRDLVQRVNETVVPQPMTA